MQKPKKGGDVKKAPPGFFLPGEARKRLGVTQAIFRAMVTRGELERVIPPGRSEGFYRVADINKLADQQALFYLQHVSTVKYEHTTFSPATADDAEGIFNVTASLGWPSTPVEVRRSWYKANDKIDYVVKFRGLVLGYVQIVPYIPETLEAMMAGKKRGWDIRQHDILPFEPGKSYDVFTGIAVRQDIPGHAYYAKRLIYGFFGALGELAREGILLSHMYATSDQPFGIQISQDLGFVKMPGLPGDLFGRFVLDMATADTTLVRKYRDVASKENYLPRRKPAVKKILHDPGLEETLQNILETLTRAESDRHAVDLMLIDYLAESPQMTLEQQALLRSIHEELTMRKE